MNYRQGADDLNVSNASILVAVVSRALVHKLTDDRVKVKVIRAPKDFVGKIGYIKKSFWTFPTVPDNFWINYGDEYKIAKENKIRYGFGYDDDEWEEVNAEGRTWYYNKRTKISQCFHPLSPWQTFFNDDGIPYYGNRETEKCQWIHPWIEYVKSDFKQRVSMYYMLNNADIFKDNDFSVDRFVDLYWNNEQGFIEFLSQNNDEKE